MVAKLEGPIFGPYRCSNCKMMQPKQFKNNCVFCGNWFSNYEDILINEVADTFIDDVTKSPPPKEIRGWRAHISVIDDSSMVDEEDLKRLITEMKVKGQ